MQAPGNGLVRELEEVDYHHIVLLLLLFVVHGMRYLGRVPVPGMLS